MNALRKKRNGERSTTYPKSRKRYNAKMSDRNNRNIGDLLGRIDPQVMNVYAQVQ